MPVIFDEVVGSVEPEQPAAAPASGVGAADQKPDDGAVRGAIVRIETRAARLKAD